MVEKRNGERDVRMVQHFSVEDTALPGVRLIASFVSDDSRGEFIKDYSAEVFAAFGIRHKLQEVFYTVSHKGVVRAIHFQRVKEQAKLVRVIKGRIYDVVVDLRLQSTTYGQWQGFYLNDTDKRSLYIPEHFGHGYLVLEDSIVSYKCSEKFNSEYDDGIRWDDIDIAIDWPLNQVGEVILSNKDKNLQSFKEFTSKYVQSGGIIR